MGGVEDQVRAGVALRHLAERFAAPLVGDRDGDQVRGGDREVLLVDRPRAWLADVFDTQHAITSWPRLSGTSSMAWMPSGSR